MYAGTLTEADLARIHAVRDESMRVGLSTDRCDRPKAEAAVRAAYVAAGLPEPELAIWMDSPLGGAVACAALKGDQLWGQLWGQLRGQLWGQLRDQLWGQLGDQLRGQLRGQLGDQLWGQLGDQLRDQLDNMSDAYWLAYYTCALPHAELASARLDALAAAVKEAGWWWPMKGAVVLCDRPTAIHRDPRGELHHDSGPAMTYADGYAVHAWHGVRVPEDFWTWGTTRALSEANAEVRRCAIERIGWDAVTDRMALVSECDDPGNPGQVLRLYDLGEFADLYDNPARILVCANASLDRGGRRRVFGLPVPARHDDPVVAAADLFGVPVAAYRGLERAS